VRKMGAAEEAPPSPQYFLKTTIGKEGNTATF
jgi:hypothetical protein